MSLFVGLISLPFAIAGALTVSLWEASIGLRILGGKVIDAFSGRE